MCRIYRYDHPEPACERVLVLCVQPKAKFEFVKNVIFMNKVRYSKRIYDFFLFSGRAEHAAQFIDSTPTYDAHHHPLLADS